MRVEKLFALVLVFALTGPVSYGRWIPKAGPDGLVIEKVVPHPRNQQTWYLTGSKSGGNFIAKTQDDGETYEWIEIPEPSPDRTWFNFDSFTCSPINADELYIGGTIRNDPDRHGFLYHSADGGRTWNLLEAGSLFTDADLSPRLIQISPDGQKLFVSEARDMGCSGDRYSLWISLDGGQSFTNTFSDDQAYSQLKVHFTHRPDLMYLHSYYQLLISYNGGFDWEEQEFGDNIADLVVDAEFDNVLYAFRRPDGYYSPYEFQKSADRGASWHSVSNNLWEYALNFYYCRIISNLADPNTLYILSDAYDSSVSVLQSKDRGNSWFPMSNGCPGPYNSKEFVANPHNAETLWLYLKNHLYHWQPENQAPMIPLAGWNPAAVSKSRGGKTTFWAHIVDPDGPMDIRQVELLFEGMPTGIFLFDDGDHNDFAPLDGYWGTTINLPPDSISEGRYLFEVAATDYTGNESTVWPYLTIDSFWQWDDQQSARKENWLTQFRCEIAACSVQKPTLPDDPWNRYSEDDSPSIMLAGWAFTPRNAAETIPVNLTALVNDPRGYENINAVELYSGSRPVSVYMWPFDSSSADGAYSQLSGVYSLLFTIEDSVMTGSYFIELSASNRDGYRSALWPYLTVY